MSDPQAAQTERTLSSESDRKYPSPLTDAELQAMRDRLAITFVEDEDGRFSWPSGTDLGRLLIEVDRLRAERAQSNRCPFTCSDGQCQRDKGHLDDHAMHNDKGLHVWANTLATIYPNVTQFLRLRMGD
jgi:hypothetical protein